MAGREYCGGSVWCAGRRSARSRRQAAMRWPGRCRVPTSIRSGTPTATATSFQNYRHMCRELAARLQSLETSFHQDLNGDGVIGVPSSQTSAGTLTSNHNNAPGIAANSVAPDQNNSHIVTDSSSIASSLTSDIFKFVNVDPNDAHNTRMSLSSVWHDGSEISLGSTAVWDHHAIEAAIHSLNVAINVPNLHEHHG